MHVPAWACTLWIAVAGPFPVVSPTEVVGLATYDSWGGGGLSASCRQGECQNDPRDCNRDQNVWLDGLFAVLLFFFGIFGAIHRC